MSQIKRSRIDLARRYVFLCPTSLCKHFDALPQQAKDSALLVFRCSRSWFFQDPDASQDRLEARVDCGKSKKPANPKSPQHGGASRGPVSALHHTEFTREFMHWVLTKEKEDCVFWYKPERSLRALSTFFEDKIDPVNELPYRPLLLDPQWWRIRFNRTTARYITNPSVVVSILSHSNWDDLDDIKNDLDIPALQELIYQSNPTLDPVPKWSHAPSMRFVPRSPPSARGYVGQETRYRGYIDQDRARGGGGHLSAKAREHGRIPRWPEIPKDRLDNLHHLWQREEAGCTRRHVFSMHGRSTVSSAPASAR